MRVLTISNCAVRGHFGSGYVIGGFLQGLRELGCTVDLLEPDAYEIFQAVSPRATSYRQSIGMLRSVLGQLTKTRYDLVEFWGGEAWLATSLLSKRPYRPLLVQHTNGPEPRYISTMESAGLIKLTAVQRAYNYALVPQAFRKPDGIVTVSDFDLQWLRLRGWPTSGRRVAINNALPATFIGRPYKPRDTRTIGFCGTWLPKKGLNVLVPDITKALRSFRDWRFLILGADNNELILSDFPNDVHQQIEIAPIYVDKNELAAQYERIEIFVLPSVLESFGIALAEAMACGCAAITTKVGFGASLRDGIDALMLNTPASPLLYNAIAKLIRDTDLRIRLSIAAHDKVQKLHWRTASISLLRTYEEWISAHSKAMQ